MYYQTKYGSKRISSSKDTVEILMFWSYELLQFWPWTANHFFFCRTLQLIMMHHNTKFGNKMLGGLENISWTNINILTLTVTLTLNAVIFFFLHHTLAYDNVSSDQVWLPRNQQFRKYSSKSYVDHMSLRCDLDLEDSTQKTKNKSAWYSGSWCSITILNLVTKCYVIQKISSGQTFTDILNICRDLDLERSNPIFPQDTLSN